MQDYIARRPIADRKATVCGYRLIYGHNTENLLNETVTGYTEFGPVTQSLFFDTVGELADHTAAYLDFTEGLADIAENCAMIKESA
ncbi:MAG: hypothetical protein GX847_02290, partial [Clostridiales bacterium]|nr:hypothetical protein [Clostridiales bacterium]